MKKILFAIIIFIVGALAYMYWGVYDRGLRAGNIVRISEKGIIFKTYEGQINIQTFGGLKRVNPIVESFDFSVDSKNEQVLKDLQEAALSGERVNLHYVKRYIIVPWRGDTKYFATRVERVAHPQSEE